jgi:hypothetical protein
VADFNGDGNPDLALTTTNPNSLTILLGKGNGTFEAPLNYTLGGRMLHEWALHDLGHVRQIAELVGARKYLMGAGQLGEDYRLKP